MFPQLEGRALTHAWGGPIDIAPVAALVTGSLPGGRVHYAYGYTGNGVGPSQLAGRILASLALDRRDEWTALPLVDPPPGRARPARAAAVGRRDLGARRAAPPGGGRGARGAGRPADALRRGPPAADGHHRRAVTPALSGAR